MHPKACWILCTPRTGSSLLCELLNNLGAFPHFDHPGLKHHRGPLEVGQAFNEWFRLYDSLPHFLDHPPPYAKVIFHQYAETFANIARGRRYGVGWYPEKHDKNLLGAIIAKYDSEFVRHVMPDMRFIRLRREPVSHAISIYFARTTKKYHIYSKGDLSNYMDSKIELNESKLIETYKDALDYDKAWDSFLKGDEELMDVDYDDLCNNTEVVLNKIVNYLGVKGDVNKSLSNVYGNNPRIYKMTRPEASEFESKLRSLTKVKV